MSGPPELDLSQAALGQLLDAALAEDIGSGDLTSRCTVDAEIVGRAQVVARQDLLSVGLVLFDPLARKLAALGSAGDGADKLVLRDCAAEGQSVAAAGVLCRIEGPARALLTIERTFLNFIGHLSGIATQTDKFVSAVKAVGAPTRILDTRKTTPAWRVLEKYAVACGGGSNHRMGLFDAILIKDNHVVAAGGIVAAVRRALAEAPAGIRVEVECDDFDQLHQALDAGAQAVLLDNFTPSEVGRAVAEVAGRARVEVSGGVTLDTVADYALAGADDISIGRLTHSAPAADVSMEIDLVR